MDSLNTSLPNMVEQVFDVAMSQLVDKDKLYPKQEQIKSSSQTPKQTLSQFPPLESSNQPSTFENRVTGVFDKFVATVGE